MRKILSFLACLMPLAASAYTSVQFSLSLGNLNISPFTNVQVTLQQVGINQNATMQFLGEPIYQFTDTNAQTTFANLQTAAGGATSYWQWTVPANSTPNGPINSYSGYIQVTSTNLGLVSASLIGVFAVPTPTGLGWAYSAQTSDLRYAQGTNTVGGGFSLGSYVTGSNTNPLVGFLGVDTNFDATETATVTAYIVGPVPAFITNGLATTNYANALTNGFTSIVFTNPAFFLVLATTNYANALTNGFTSIVYSNPTSFVVLSQVTNIAQQQANAVGLNDTNYATGATNIAVANLTTGLAGTNTALVAALNATNLLLIADINTASNAVKVVSQPGSGVLTNLAVTGALTNGLSAGQNFSLTTNGSGTFIFLNATNQVFLTNGLVQWSGLQPTAYASTNALASATNGLVYATVTNGLATLQAATNVAQGVYSNNPAGYITSAVTNGLATLQAATNVAQGVYSNNPAGYITSAGTNSAATTNYVQTYADTNGAAAAAVKSIIYQGGSGILTNIAATGALTNGLVPGLNLTITTNGSGTFITINATNQTFLTNGLLTGYAPTNTLNGWYDTNGAGAAAALAATNGMLPIVTNIAKQYASANVNTNQYVAGSNVALTTNISGSIIYVNATNQTFLTNGLLTGYAPTNTLNGWYDTNNAALWAYTNSVAYSTNYATTNTAAAVATALNFAATNTALPFVPTNAGTVSSLTIGTSLIFGADTNFILGTNWITVKGAGSGQANGVYNQIAPGVYTNNSFTGVSIVNSGGIFNLLNTNGQTLYVTNTVNGFWLVGPYGSLPKPYVAFSPTFDPILLGNIYATNLAAQWQAYVVAYIATNQFGGQATNAIANTNGFGTNTTLRGSTIIQGLEIVGGVTSNSVNGTITFLDGSQIKSANTYLGSLANDLGVTIGAGNSLVSSQQMNIVIGYTNSVVPPILGGTTNSIGNAILGGFLNNIGNQGGGDENYYDVIAGGYSNYIGNGYAETIAGGYGNFIGNGDLISGAFIAGGLSNQINQVGGTTTIGSFIGGIRGYVTNSGTFLWNDGSGGVFNSFTSNSFVIHATNGVGINTNYPGIYALEVSGPIDTTVGYTINGRPISVASPSGYFINQLNGTGTNIYLFQTNFISGTYFQSAATANIGALQVTGSTNAYANGVYITATNNNTYYTNTVSKWELVNLFAILNVSNSPIGQFFICTNFEISGTSINLGVVPPYNSWNLFGTYCVSNAINPVPASYAYVSAYGAITNITSVGVAINTNSVGTNTLEVNGQIDTVGGYSVRGFTGASQTVPIQTNTVGPHGITLLFTNGIFFGTQNY